MLYIVLPSCPKHIMRFIAPMVFFVSLCLSLSCGDKDEGNDTGSEPDTDADTDSDAAFARGEIVI
jgi:hypothetical protein